MRPLRGARRWKPSAVERAVIKAVRRAKLFVFLRERRHKLFDEQFQAELAQAHADSPKGPAAMVYRPCSPPSATSPTPPGARPRSAFTGSGATAGSLSARCSPESSPACSAALRPSGPPPPSPRCLGWSSLCECIKYTTGTRPPPAASALPPLRVPTPGLASRPHDRARRPPVVIDGGDRTCAALLLELRDHTARLRPGK